MSLWVRVNTPTGTTVVLEFPTVADRERFEQAMERIEAAGDDPGLRWEALYGQYGGRVVAVVEQ